MIKVDELRKSANTDIPTLSTETGATTGPHTVARDLLKAIESAHVPTLRVVLEQLKAETKA